MKLIGFNYEKISAEKKKTLENPISINTDMKVKDIKKVNLDLFKDKDTFSIDYEYLIDWNKQSANIFFKGSLILLSEGKEDENLFNTILEDWKTKKISEDFATTLLKIIFTKSHLKALQIEEHLNLPSHTPLPQFSKNHK